MLTLLPYLPAIPPETYGHKLVWALMGVNAQLWVGFCEACTQYVSSHIPSSVLNFPVSKWYIPLFDCFESCIGKWYVKVVFEIFDCFGRNF